MKVGDNSAKRGPATRTRNGQPSAKYVHPAPAQGSICGNAALAVGFVRREPPTPGSPSGAPAGTGLFQPADRSDSA
jgi:hypothetical protein